MKKRLLNYLQFINENNSDFIKNELNKLNQKLVSAFSHSEEGEDGKIERQGDVNMKQEISGINYEDSDILKNILTFQIKDEENLYKFIFIADEKITEKTKAEDRKCKIDLTILNLTENFTEIKNYTDPNTSKEEEIEKIDARFLIDMISELKPKEDKESLNIEFEK